MEPDKKLNIPKILEKTLLAANPESDLTLQTDEEQNHQDQTFGWFGKFVKSADNPLKNLPEDEVEEWLLIDENKPVEQELIDDEIIKIVINLQLTQNLEDSDSEAKERKYISLVEAAESLRFNKFYRTYTYIKWNIK